MKSSILKFAVGAALMSATFGMSAQQVAPTTSDSVATVYFIKDITPENILKIYDALDRRATGKVCVKLSFGESGNPNHLSPQLIEPLVRGLDATLVECNTAYQSSRHYRAGQDDFLETMAESSKAIIDRAGDNINILYISVANNLSVDCDCVAHPAPVQMADIGIFASLDPVALDRACVDAVHNSPDHGKIHMEQRIAERNGMHLLDYAESLGIGTQKYVLITIE